MKILVVDDEVLVAQYVVQCIRDADSSQQVVGTAASGSRALQIMQEQPVDLVFADITMPKMDGLELLSAIKAQYPSTSVIMLTCHDEFEYARQAIQNRADNYVLKFELSPQTMADILQKEQTRRERQADQAKGGAVKSGGEDGREDQARQSGRYSEPISRAMEFISAHYTEDLTLNMVADHVFLNREYLSRRFKQEVGMTFSEFLADLRLQQAKELLETTGLRVSEVAARIGIPNVSYFSTIFRKRFHCSPSDLRSNRGGNR